MNRIQAEKINKELKLIMGEKAEKLNIDKQVGKDLIEKYIEFHPDENSKMGMLDLNSQHSRSVKLPNIIINQKEMWLEEVGIIACSTIPKNKVEFWKLLLYVAVVTLRLMNIKITDEQAYIVAYLHINHMYETGQNEQEFYAEKGFTNEPRRCPACRQARKQRMGVQNDRPQREMFPAVCAECGKETMVPFKPSDRPVYCRECFNARKH